MPPMTDEFTEAELERKYVDGTVGDLYRYAKRMLNYVHELEALLEEKRELQRYLLPEGGHANPG